MVNFPTRISDCDSCSPALLDLFISSDASVCSTITLPPLRNSDHAVVSVSIDFLSDPNIDTSFHYTAYDYSLADWGGCHDYLRDVPWKETFKLCPSAATSELYEWVQFVIDICILQHKYQVKPYHVHGF